MTKIYLDLPNDIQLLFEENQISIEEVLANLDIDHKVTYESPPYQEEVGVRTKDLVTVIIVAGAAAVMAISFAISQVIDTLQRRPYFVELHEIEEIRDSDGNVVIDSQGRPVVKVVKRYEILEPRAEDRKREFEFHFDLKQGVVIKVRSEEKQIPEKETKELDDQQKDKKQIEQK